ncbi:MAG: LicD family protein [Ruminococcaceae bacterium]|nr:LicD family protein [Oscillospiraceae bacterium]
MAELSKEKALEQIHELQQIAMDMLLDISAACRKAGLRFYMAEGSLIGAIRHKGFIPWDDDIDLAMPREDYEKFLQVGQELLGEKYRLQHSTTVENYWSPFIKVRLITDDPKFRQMHIAHLTKDNGPLIDIFPLDNVPKLSSFSQRLNRRKIGLYRGMITRKLGCLPHKSLSEKLAYFLSKFYTVERLHKKLDRLHVKYNSPDNGFMVNWASYYSVEKETFPREAFGEPLYVPFEKYEMPVPQDYDTVLTTIYGDYMTPPPEDKRVIKHHFGAESGD